MEPTPSERLVEEFMARAPDLAIPPALVAMGEEMDRMQLELDAAMWRRFVNLGLRGRLRLAFTAVRWWR